ncbi:MAG: MFS transporter [Chloroflexota bacterium]|nr:MFS transporter [Chloroflexota bacterium]
MSRGAEIARRSAFFLVRISLFWFGLSFLWGGMNIQLLPTRVPELVDDEIKGTAIGAIVVVGLIVAILVQPMAGAFSDRVRLRWGRRRPIMAAGIAAAMPCLLFVAYAPNYGLLFVAMVLLQIAANIAHGPYQGVIPDQVPTDSRGRASGFFGLANLMGTLVGAGVAGAWLSMAAEGQDPNPFFAPALLTIMVVLGVFSIAAWFSVREQRPPEQAPFEGVLREVRTRLRELSQRSAFAWLMLSRLLYFMGLQAMDNFIQLFLKGDQVDGGLAESDAEFKTTIVLAAVLLTALITTVPAGWLADRYGKLRLVATAAALGLIAAAVLMTSQSFVQVVIFAAVLGVGVGLFTAADWAVAIDLIPDQRAPGLYMGLSNVATAGGDGLATLSAGIALDLFGYRAVFAMMAIFFGLSLVVLPVVRARLAAAQAPPPT